MKKEGSKKIYSAVYFKNQEEKDKIKKEAENRDLTVSRFIYKLLKEHKYI